MEPASEARITAIEPQQKRRYRVSIFLDGEFALGVHQDVVAALGLVVGQRIAPERLKRIVQEETITRARDRALLLLSYRARTESEIRSRLNLAGYEPEVIQTVIERLYEWEYLDDSRFARTFVEHRLASRPEGRRALQWELRRKGVKPETVEEATSQVDGDSEKTAALQAAQSRLSRLASEQPRDARRKLGAFLQRRGFMWDTIKNVLDELIPARDGDGGHVDAP